MRTLKFPTRYSEKKPVCSNPGERFKQEYQLRINEKGTEELVPTGKTDIQAFIDSHYETVDMNVILQRLENGDLSVLDDTRAFYADVSEIPGSMFEIMNLNRQGKEIFDKLPLDLKQVYGNDYLQFVMEPMRGIEYLDNKEKEKISKMESEVIGDDHEEQ